MSRVDRLRRELGHVLAANLAVVLLCVITGGGGLRDMRPRLEVRNKTSNELGNLGVATRSAYPNVFRVPPVAAHSGLTLRMEPSRGDILQAHVESGSRGRIVSKPLYVSNQWDYDMRLRVASGGVIRLSQVPRVGAAANAAGAWSRRILVVSGAIVWLAAPVFTALWSWRLQKRSDNLRRALEFLMPPAVALVATLGVVQGVAVHYLHQEPPPIHGTPLAALTIVGGFWVLLVGAVNAACLLGNWAMPAHEDVDGRHESRIALVLVHVALLIMSVWAFVSTIWQRTLVPAMDWGMNTDQVQSVMFMDTWGTFGRLSLLAMGIYLAGLIARGDIRVPRYYVWYGLALLAFEAALHWAQHQLWGVPRGTNRGPYSPHMVVYAGGFVAWAAYLLLSRMSRATFVHEPPAVDSIGRRLIGLGALALIVWPFALNQFVDATNTLTGHISPRDGTPGRGFAEGILAMSVATGLFVLMKHAWRMRRRWIAVLLPVCFAVLVLLYGMQGFMLHWTF